MCEDWSTFVMPWHKHRVYGFLRSCGDGNGSEKAIGSSSTRCREKMWTIADADESQ